MEENGQHHETEAAEPESGSLGVVSNEKVCQLRANASSQANSDVVETAEQSLSPLILRKEKVHTLNGW